jgi:transposase InsO family protein
MDVHKNARTTPHSRALMARRVAAGETPAAVARALGLCDRTVHKWVARAADGPWALEDRSCRPRHSPRAISTGLMVEIQRLRQQRWTGAAIAEAVRLSRATVARTLTQLGLARLAAGEAVPPGRRYEWERPGQLLHIDTKKLGRIDGIGHRITGDRRQRVRGIGWEFVHVCLDDCSRLAYAEVLPDEQRVTVAGFLRRALAWFARRGVQAQRVLSDNGSAYRSRLVAATCAALELQHRFTRPYTPRTNGKAERFIQTLLREWAYAVAYLSSAHRTAALARWLHHYNWHRPHSALNRQPPITRVVAQDDLLRLHS